MSDTPGNTRTPSLTAEEAEAVERVERTIGAPHMWPQIVTVGTNDLRTLLKIIKKEQGE